ncbi:MAG: hypothetical protein CL916_02090 [Deltaproteobacteria bacterium]|nr:hypothetical protein [Deltaproteobacteria bacterium]
MNLFKKYSSLFTPHRSVQDVRQRERAELFAWFAFHIAPLIAGLLCIQSFLALKEYAPLSPKIGIAIISLCLLLYALARSPYFQIAIYVQIILNTLICSYITLVVSPSESATIFAFTIGILTGAILLPLKESIYMTLLVCMFLVLVTIAHPKPVILIGALVITFIIIVLIYIIRFNLERAEIARKSQVINEEQQHIAFIKTIFDGVAFIEEDHFTEVEPHFGTILNIKQEILRRPIHTVLPSSIDLSTPLQSISLLDDERGIRFLQILYEKRHYRKKQIMAVRDITNQTMHKDQLMFTNQMVSTGMLTTSIIHDISSPLMVLQHSIESLKETSHPSLAMIQSLDHISSLFDSLRHYIRPETQSISTHLIIDRALQIVRSRMRCNIEKEVPPLSKSIIPQHQLLQVLINLLMNSSQEVDKAGTIRITAKQEELIEIIIEDTGPGIPPNIQKHIFEPYYTTKEKGTGLGLAISQKILLSYGGRIKLDSSYTNGCRFILSFPKENDVESETEILIVDDEPLICELLEEALEEYSTTITYSAEEALELLTSKSFSLILCDITLPEKSGWDVFLKWKKSGKGSFIFISGGIHLLPDTIDLEHEQVDVLSKPFHLQQLYSLVDKHLY